jgi:hypothetical protein
MNASRRICCNAANAFRPAAALRTVFYEPIPQRQPRRAYTGAAGEATTHGNGVRYEDVYKAGRVTRSETTGVNEENLAAALDSEDIQTQETTTNSQQRALRQQKIEDAHLQEEEDVRKLAKTLDDIYVQRESDGTRSNFQSPKLADIVGKKVARQEEDVLEYEAQNVLPVKTYSVKLNELPWRKGLELGNKHVSGLKRLVHIQ